MKMAKQVLMVPNLWFVSVIVIMALINCAGSPKASGPDELNAAIREASDYLKDNIPGGNKIVILNIQSSSPALSEYIIDELIANAVNDKVFSVVDRQQLDVIRAELDFQLAGEVDDNSAQEIGKMLGAQTIVSGAFSKVGENYRMRIRALEVQTAQVQGQFNRNIPNGPTIADLMNSGASGYGSGNGQRAAQGGASGGGSGSSGGGSGTSGGAAQTAQAPAAPAYKIGDTGPAGGLIFYDKGNSNGGWRYLEAAPADYKTAVRCFSSYWYPDGKLATGSAVGTGKTNTEEVMGYFNQNGGGFGYGVQVCDELVVNGFDDWFLPSIDELNYMYGNLHRRELGEFRNEKYWSSSTIDGGYGQCLDFKDGSGKGSSAYCSLEYRVRAARRF